MTDDSRAYDHASIEKKWQDKWDKDGIYKTAESSDKPKQYILDMFPYPSGEGLHVGHPRGYIATDVYSRKKRMEGYNVLHPMGWDAFGLPAENFAIKNKVHPSVAVDQNVARFKQQLSLIGLDYDWSREINTTDPAFYKWTQWIFLQMYKKGLAFESFEPINWCPSCQTGLANEDVEADGTCERCGTKVEKKPMRQWVLKITDYADRLLADLDKLPKWPDGVKEAQRHWIGRSEGSELQFAIKDSAEKITVFTTRADTLFGVTYVVLAPEHPLVSTLPFENKDEVAKYVASVQEKTDIDRTNAKKEKTGVELKGITAINPANGEEIPVWVADYVLANYGTGAVMGVPQHDERDRAFAETYNLPIVDKELVDAAEVTTKVGGKIKSTYKIKDWVFSRQRYWGEPIPLIHCADCGIVAVPEKDLPVVLPEVEHYEPSGTGESPLADIASWVNVPCPTCGKPAKRETNTMPQWAGSSWYYLRYIDPTNAEALIDPTKEKDWMPVDVYVGGDHATRHLIYARFWHKFLFDIGVVTTEEPFPRLEFLGFILAEDGRKMSKRWKNVVNPDDVVKQFGADAFRLYEMFIGPFEGTVPWSTNGLVGTYRFVEKFWRAKSLVTNDTTSASLLATVHKTIQKVSQDIESFKFNTAVSTLMIAVNEIEKEKQINIEDYKKLLQIMAPFAPHVAEELWMSLGEKASIHLSSWPKYDETLAIDESVTIGVQINGKLRGEITIAPDASKEEIEAAALTLPRIQELLEGKSPAKVIVVPGKIVSIVV